MPAMSTGSAIPGGFGIPARADIAVVGQSFAQGYCVPDGKGFVDLLRTHDLVVLNLGESGQSSLLQLAAIKEYLPRYAPKTVLWIFTEGIDLPDLYVESTHPLSRRYLDPDVQPASADPSARDRRVPSADVSGIETRERAAYPTVPARSLVERSLPILKLWNLRQKLELAYGAQRGAAREVHARAGGGQRSAQYPGAGSDDGQFLGWHALLRLPSQLESISERARGR